MIGGRTETESSGGSAGYGAASTTDPNRSAYYAPLLAQLGERLPILSA